MHNYIKLDDGYFEVGGEKLSPDEFHSTYCICCECGDAIDRDFAAEVSNKYYCENCRDSYLFYCEDCGQWLRINEEIGYNDTCKTTCCDCADDYHYVCDRCGGRFYYTDSITSDGDGTWCEECYEEYRSIISEYHDFKSSEEYEFFGEELRLNCPYLGFELEVDGGSRCDKAAKDVENIFPNYFHYEEDGSIGNGFEIISQPSSLNYILGFMDVQMMTEVLM